jgi:hypothetical protein
MSQPKPSHNFGGLYLLLREYAIKGFASNENSFPKRLRLGFEQCTWPKSVTILLNAV